MMSYATFETATPSRVRVPRHEEVPGGRFSANLYGPCLWLGERRGMRARRRRLLAGARGRVLEIGAGTGHNVPHYGAGVDELILAEPVREMLERIDASPLGDIPVSLVEARAEELPFADDSFDTVVSTMVLCTVADVDASLSEIKRVLRPGGRLLFCEHVRSDSPRFARWQDRLAGPWAAFAEGCRCDRATLGSIASRMELTRVERDTWKGMAFVLRPLVVGEAVA